MVDSLEFWRKIDDRYFHLCKHCCTKKEFADCQLLMIGFHYGQADVHNDLDNWLEARWK